MELVPELGLFLSHSAQHQLLLRGIGHPGDPPTCFVVCVVLMTEVSGCPYTRGQ